MLYLNLKQRLMLKKKSQNCYDVDFELKFLKDFNLSLLRFTGQSYIGEKRQLRVNKLPSK